MEKNGKRIIRAQSVTKAGQQHEQENTACEDVCVSIETERLRFYALADGQSGKRYCREGAQAVLHALAAYIRRTSVAALLRQSYEDEVQYALTRVIRSTIEALSESYQAEAAAFSSTVIALAVDPQTGEYLSVHLGDGAILGVKKDMEPVLLSPPENGMTSRSTWLTTSPDALRHVRLRRGKTCAIDRLVLVTDGASMLCRGVRITRRAEALLCDLERPERILAEVHRQSAWDDAGCIVVDFV